MTSLVRVWGSLYMKYKVKLRQSVFVVLHSTDFFLYLLKPMLTSFYICMTGEDVDSFYLYCHLFFIVNL